MPYPIFLHLGFSPNTLEAFNESYSIGVSKNITVALRQKEQWKQYVTFGMEDALPE